MWQTMLSMDTPSNPTDTAALILNANGVLQLIRGKVMVELHLRPEQLLLLASDALRAALALDPTLRPELDAAVAAWQREVASEGPWASTVN